MNISFISLPKQPLAYENILKKIKENGFEDILCDFCEYFEKNFFGTKDKSPVYKREFWNVLIESLTMSPEQQTA